MRRRLLWQFIRDIHWWDFMRQRILHTQKTEDGEEVVGLLDLGPQQRHQWVSRVFHLHLCLFVIHLRRRDVSIGVGDSVDGIRINATA